MAETTTEDKRSARKRAKKRRQYVLRAASALLLGAAVAKELRKPAEEREWRGKLGFVPYDLRPPTPVRVKAAFWNPDDPRVFTDRPFGVGWAVNFGRLYQLWKARAAAG